MEQKNFQSDAQWYCREDSEADCFYDIFFALCRKYRISWASATEKERAFIEEVTRVTYEREMARRMGLSTDNLRPSFVS